MDWIDIGFHCLEVLSILFNICVCHQRRNWVFFKIRRVDFFRQIKQFLDEIFFQILTLRFFKFSVLYF